MIMEDEGIRTELALGSYGLLHFNERSNTAVVLGGNSERVRLAEDEVVDGELECVASLGRSR